MSSEANLLFTGSGRRVPLVRAFRTWMKQTGVPGRVVTADLKPNAPTAYVSDAHYLVPRPSDPDYVHELLTICKDERVRAIVPLIDPELPVLAEHKPLFAEHGVEVIVSSPSVVEIGCDKLAAFHFFTQHGIPTPKVYPDGTEPETFPVMVKPRNGSSAIGVTVVRSPRELEFFRAYVHNSMVQEFVSGTEYTVDLMLDLHGNVKTVVPRERLETRAGEVSKGVTRKNARIIDATVDLASKLTGAVGCVNVQCFHTDDDRLLFIEINPRFGGGAPLSIAAGANLPKWTIDLIAGATFDTLDLTWRDGLVMLRYDDAIFTES